MEANINQTIDEKSLKCKASKLGVDHIDLDFICPESNALGLLAPELISKYCVLPFKVSSNMLSLAMKNPDDIYIIDEIKILINMEIKPYLADESLLDKAIKFFYGIDAAKAKADVKDDATFIKPSEEKVQLIDFKKEELFVKSHKQDTIKDIIEKLRMELFKEIPDIKDFDELTVDLINKQVKVTWMKKFE